MSFEGQYLTFAEYEQLGGTLTLTPFNLLEYEARRQIDLRTYNRVKSLETIPEEVKMCEYKLINSLENYMNASNNISSNGNVASENIDGYSVSYITADRISSVVKSRQDEMKDIVYTYLTNVIVDGKHLVYCGADE